jgi:hypothetical protein
MRLQSPPHATNVEKAAQHSGILETRLNAAPPPHGARPPDVGTRFDNERSVRIGNRAGPWRHGGFSMRANAAAATEPVRGFPEPKAVLRYPHSDQKIDRPKQPSPAAMIRVKERLLSGAA